MKKSWDEYFLELCDLISTRSIDPSTKHGCVIVDKDRRIVSVGYNGPVKGLNDANIPLTRPLKYKYFLHSEENALLFSKVPLDDCTAYITGLPCSRCTRMLLQKGILKIVCGNRSSVCVDTEDLDVSFDMIRQKNASISVIQKYDVAQKSTP